MVVEITAASKMAPADPAKQHGGNRHNVLLFGTTALSLGRQPLLGVQLSAHQADGLRQAGAFDRLSYGHSLRLGELVRITAGAFQDMIGRLVELRDQDRVVVLLELLGRTVRAQLEAGAVEAA